MVYITVTVAESGCKILIDQDRVAVWINVRDGAADALTVEERHALTETLDLRRSDWRVWVAGEVLVFLEIAVEHTQRLFKRIRALRVYAGSYHRKPVEIKLHDLTFLLRGSPELEIPNSGIRSRSTITANERSIF